MKKLIVLVLVALACAGPATAAYTPKTPPAPGKTLGAGAGPWPIFLCAGGIVSAALIANFQQNRELTAVEAMTCGTWFYYGFAAGGYASGR